MKYATYLALMAGANAKAMTPEPVKLDRIALEKIVGGVLRGALHAEGFDDINHCIADAEEVFGDAENAYKDFKAGGATNVLNGLKELGDLLKTVKAGMSDCSHIKADWQKLAKMVSVFDSPASFAYHVGKDLIVNGRNIYGEINTAITDYENANWDDFGFQVGEAAAQALIGAPTPAEIRNAEMLRGMTEAFGGNFNLEALLACVHYEDMGALLFDEAYEEFKTAYAKKEWQDALAGVIAIVGGVQQVKQGLPACEAVDPKSNAFDFAGFNKSLDITPAAFLNTEVAEEAAKAGEAIQNNDYYTVGRHLGNMLKIAKPQETPKEQIAAEVASGLLKATNVGSFNLQNLLICIYQADNAAEIADVTVKQAIKAWNDKKINDAIPVLIGAFAFVQQMEQTLPVCESVDTSKANWTVFDNIVNTVGSDPEQYIKKIGDNVIVNGVEITWDMKEAFESLEEKNYVHFGEKIGEALVAATQDQLFLF